MLMIVSLSCCPGMIANLQHNAIPSGHSTQKVRRRFDERGMPHDGLPEAHDRSNLVC
jgi:hypothetical protein